MPNSQTHTVASSREYIVYVDGSGHPTGETAEKLAAHTADTRLHLAFSCYVFNDEGKFLVTQRAHGKKVWPNVWTNSVCGHPAPGEAMTDAIIRRAAYELNMTLKDFQVMVPDYTYKTTPYDGIIDHEFCPIHIARATSEPKPNPDEVDALRWVDWSDYMAATLADEAADGNEWSWWCKDQLKLLKDHPLIADYSRPV